MRGPALVRRRRLDRGSPSWLARVAEVTAWGTAAVLFLVLHSTPLPPSRYRTGVVLVALLALWIAVTFRVLLPRTRRARLVGLVGLVAGFAFAGALYALLRDHVPSIQLGFVPVIVVVGLLTNLAGGVAAAAAATIEYLLVARAVGTLPGPVLGLLNGATFFLAGSVAGLLARELASRYSGEQHEHRVAVAVRQRLLAVLDAVGEAIVFRDRQGIVRIVNQRAEALFETEAGAHLGKPAVELLRSIARRTEDPEGFMETFQELRDDPDLQIRADVELIIPERRQLRLLSRPTRDDSGTLVGRIDVYTDVTESVARAAEIERLYEEARKTAESYQRGLLPSSPPSLPRVNTVVHYVPAAGRRAVCGDFYDFVPLAAGRQAVVLGDVCGIGPRAASDAALARYTLRSLATEETDPSELVARLNDQVGRQVDEDRFVRLLLGVLDPDGESLEYVNAGHVPPVVFRKAAGKVEWLPEGNLALGVVPGARYEAERIELEPGDMVLFYTDGVTEAARGGKPLGQARLADLVADYGVGTPGELVQAVRRAVQKWVGDHELRDDLALLACQVAVDARTLEPSRELVLPNDPARLGDAREFVAGFLADVRASVEASQELLLAVGEAVANACRHGARGGARTEIRIRCLLEGADVTVSVSDEGEGFDLSSYPADALPDRFASGGRGLFLMRQFVDACSIDTTPEGTTVHLRHRVLPPPS